MAQLTNEQWSAMTQAERDKFLRDLVSCDKVVTPGRVFMPCPAKPKEGNDNA